MILVLFFTRGVSLGTCVNQGLFDREKILYEEHLNRGNLSKVYWLTYGSEDKKLSEQLKQKNSLHRDIEVFEMPRIFNIYKIGSYLYSLFLPIYHKNAIKQSNILKTNQMDGSWSGVFSKWIYAKPLIVRSGYTMSQLEHSKNQDSLRYKYYFLIEKFAYKFCNIAIVSSVHNKKYLLENKYLNKNNVKIITNFIDVDTFKHTNKKKYENKILFVGRLNEEKNIFNLIKAISKTNLTLDIYGNGNIEKEIKEFVKKTKANVNFMGIVANKQLPNIYNSYKYYVLPSYFEGMPKTLLEAMACGCVCIGTNVNGINEVIKDNVNGYLASNVDCDSLQETISKAINLDNKKITLNAIKDIQDNYSLQSITEKEKNVIDIIA